MDVICYVYAPLAVNSAGSQEVVAAGGYFIPGLFVQYFSDVVEIYSLDTRSWRNGKLSKLSISFGLQQIPFERSTDIGSFRK